MNTAEIEQEFTQKINAANDLGSLDTIRVEALGKKGRITELMKGLGKLDPDQRKEQAVVFNDLKNGVMAKLESRQSILKKAAMAERLKAEKIDITLDVRPERKGTIHPITQTMDEMIAIFADMGFSIHDGPDIEDDFHNFTALNFPPNHPAREMQDTFFLPDVEGAEGSEAKRLLRTHTSTCQIRGMMELGAPLRKIVMGRVYRAEAMDTTHSAMFHQIEGMVIDTKTNMGHLKGCLKIFCEKFFGVDDLPVRFRPSFFPFTEPSAEIDIGCSKSREKLTIGGGDDWLELGGCGMVHPNVLKNVGIDSDLYQGFAFGLGIERMEMLKYGITDVRSFYEGDTRWNAHYGHDPLNKPNLATGS
jgi:phenylalanyl-tRNA synthetase alpha chain